MYAKIWRCAIRCLYEASCHLAWSWLSAPLPGCEMTPCKDVASKNLMSVYLCPHVSPSFSFRIFWFQLFSSYVFVLRFLACSLKSFSACFARGWEGQVF